MHAEGFFYFLVSPASLLVATLSESLSTSLSVVLFNRCGGHFPPFEPRGKSAVTQSTLPELATLEPAITRLEVTSTSAQLGFVWPLTYAVDEAHDHLISNLFDAINLRGY
jgi:hypothetical protein